MGSKHHVDIYYLARAPSVARVRGSSWCSWARFTHAGGLYVIRGLTHTFPRWGVMVERVYWQSTARVRCALPHIHIR